MFRTFIIGATAAMLTACGPAKGGSSNPVTLYRNSPFGTVRVHWATFDADESDPAYNLNNCMMAARLLNANTAAFAQSEGKRPDNSVGFWCESGRYKEKGNIPPTFDAAFPTDV
ncbi:hypothetical protein [Novosphingobium sp. TCA1]|uniref:hypothetical protein n=1 Tax=Novosphingobium sp. TCA1 TaxID=2682474 RepID=UPI0013571721|nr:hypothetical protein [Novosphingobium sp. TCA1]